MVLGRLAPDFRVAARAESARQLTSDVDLEVSFREKQRLSIRVGRDELDVFQTGSDHPVNSVRATTTNADYLDNGVVIALTETHGLPLVISSIVTAFAGRRGEQVIEG